MKQCLEYALIMLNFIRCFPHLIVYNLHPSREIIKIEINRWLKMYEKNYSCTTGLIYLLGFWPEYRNLFYYRIGVWGYFLNILCRKVSTLMIDTKEIGVGLWIGHGFATAIGAKSIGKNCTIGQMVTIGDYFGEKPTILNNVRIHAGATIIGGIIIGNNSIIGANTTVFRDVPDNCTVFADQSRIIRWHEDIRPDSCKE